MNIKYAFITKQGDRNINEDCIGTAEKENSLFFALADGLGGHGMGDKASKTAVTVSLAIYDSNKLEPGALLQECFISSQNKVLEIQQELRKEDSIKTTLVTLLIDNNIAYWGHIGDSRMYIFKKGKKLLRTKDHSVPQMLYMVGDIKEKEIRTHEDRNKLLKVIGVKWDKPKFELTEEPLTVKKEDSFLLCSDGFWEWIEERRMIKTLNQSTTPDEWLALMEQNIIKAGRNNNMDNYSAIAVFVE